MIVAHNVESLIWQRYHETEANPLKRWYVGRQWRKFERFERRAYGEADCTVAVSADDAARIRGWFGAGRVQVIDNGVDTLFTFNPIGFRGGTGLSEEGAGVSLPERARAIEMYGVAAHRLFWSAGATFAAYTGHGLPSTVTV